MDTTITDQELTEFLRRGEEAATAYLQGDVERYLDLLHHAEGFTLLRPNAADRPLATKNEPPN